MSSHDDEEPDEGPSIRSPETLVGAVSWNPLAGEAAGPAAGDDALLDVFEDESLTLTLEDARERSPVGMFGRYEVLGRIAFGGMAEVLLGRERTQAGATRLLAIKRILRHVADDEHFVGMFLDEARLGMHLSHPNICHIYEFGELDGSYFIAMEWVNGVSLGALARHPLVRGTLPVDIAVKIVATVAGALDHANTATDDAGRPLDVVHRDVSPHNIMVAYDGHPKLLDFGVAKAASHVSKTEVGTVKGKYAYMAPEQCLDQDLDGRVDVFSLGICLWEALTGEALFKRDNEFETMKAIIEGKTPCLGDLRDDVPEDLERIVQKALSRDREDRYARAGEFQAALEGWLAQRQQFVSASKIAALMSKLYTAEIRRGPLTDPAIFDDPIRPIAGTPPSIPTQRDPAHPSAARRMAGRWTAATSDSFSLCRAGSSSDLRGRDADLVELRRRLDDGDRLVTIIGPAGVGKTSLSRELARQEPGRTPGRRAWFCDLSESAGEAEICAALIHALDIKGAPEGAPALVARVGRHLRSLGDALVVLDNFEQVVAFGPTTVAAWLRASPETRFVVTSRVMLRIDGERAHGLAPLDPVAAAELWQERVNMVMPGYRVEAEDPALLHEVLEGLDRLPLAIELAAARMRVMGLSDVRERLSERLQLLSGGPRDAPARQASLEAALLWSWRQLAPWERSALSQLTVFRGGFDLAAATRTLSLEAFEEAPPELDVMHALVDKSLLVVRSVEFGPGERRFSFLRTVRDFVVSRADYDAGDARTRHAYYFVELGERWVGHWEARTDDRALPILQQERENLRGASSGAAFDPVLALRAALASQPVAGAWGPIGPQLELVGACLKRAAAAGPIPAQLEARALLIRGRLQMTTRGVNAAEADWTRALELATRAEDLTLQGRAEHGVATAAHVRGEIAEALSGYERALHILRKQPHRRALGRALLDSCMLYEITGQPSLALERLDEARAAAGAVDDDLAAAVLASHGSVHLELGDYAMARDGFEQALAISRERGYRLLEGHAIGDLGVTDLLDGEVTSSLSQLETALALLEEVGDQRMACIFSGYLAVARHMDGQSEAASLGCDAARREARQLGFRHFEAYFSALSVMIRADRDRIGSAERRLAEGTNEIDADKDPINAAVAKLARAQLELARAREASQQGQPALAIHRVRAAQSTASSGGRTRSGPTPKRTTRDTRIARRLFERSLERTAAQIGAAGLADEPRFQITVDVDGKWFRLGDADQVDTGRRSAVRRLLGALCRGHLDRPGVPLPKSALIEAVWGGEKMRPESAKNRLHVTLSQLRKAGWRAHILTLEDGYLLDPRIDLTVVQE